MTQSVDIHEVISMLINALWGDFQSRCSFHILCKSGEVITVKQTTNLYGL